jgi:hypothetical protein
MNSVVLVSGIIVLVINVIILIYVLELEREKCNCSKHWMRDLIKYWSGVVIVVGVLNLIVPSVIVACATNPICSVLHGLYGLVGFAYIIILVVYYVHLNKQTECPCALDWKKHVLIVPIVMFSITFVFGFIKGFNKATLRKLSNSKKSNRN